MSDVFGEFVMPELWVGTEIEVSTDPAFTNPDWGIVVTPKRQSADIWFHGTGDGNWRGGPLEDCWYVGDPRIKENPGIINAQERRGVFRLSKREIAMRAVAGQMESLEKAVLALSKRVEVLERKAKAAMQ